MMKKLITKLLILTLTIGTSNAWAQLLFNESFPYAAGDLTANSGGNWTAHSGVGSRLIQTSPTTPLTFNGYALTGGGSVSILNDVNTGEDANRTFTAQSSGAVYASFMVRYASAGTTGDYNVHFNTSNFSTRLFAKDDGSGNLKLGIAKNSTTPVYATGNYAYNTTYLVVIKYQFVAGTTNDVASLFIFSPGNSIPNSEPASPQATESSSANADATSLSAFALRQGSIGTYSLRIGGIRVATTWQTALPVELLNFSGKYIEVQNPVTGGTEGGNLLTWTTTSETNNKGFDIERSRDGVNFSAIGTVKALGKAGNYNFTDAEPVNGTNYYRLRQIDYDGKETLSKVISIQNKGAKGKLAIYPNPVANVLTVATEEAGDFQIFNLLGQVVLSGKISPSGAAGLDVSALPQGSYVLRVGAEQVKFIKQ